MKIFSLILSIILLGVFVYLLWEAWQVAEAVLVCGPDAQCTSTARLAFNTQMENALNLIGGLVAAVVVAELAITAPSEIPGLRVFATDPNAPPPTAAKWTSVAYIGVWIVSGLLVFCWATLKHPDALESLTSYGNTWLGLSVASGYAYFGLKRNV